MVLSFPIMQHNLLFKVAKLLEIIKYCPKRPQKSRNLLQWIWIFDFQFSFPKYLKKCLFLTISGMLRMSAFQGWCCLKLIVLPIAQHSPICSEIDSKVENIEKKPVMWPIFMMQDLKEKLFLVQFSKMVTIG